MNRLTIIIPVAILFCISTMFAITACQPDKNRKEISVMSPLQTMPTLPSDAKLTRDSINGTVRLLKGHNLGIFLKDDETFKQALSDQSPERIAIAFISAYSGLFRLRNPQEELHISAVQTDNLGMTHIRLKQNYCELPVWPADLNVHVNTSNQVYLVQGKYVPTPLNLTVTPGLSDAEVLAAVARDMGIDVGDLTNYRVELIVYCGTTDSVKLAYRVYAEISPADAWRYVMDAQTGAVVERMVASQTPGFDEQSSQGKFNVK